MKALQLIILATAITLGAHAETLTPVKESTQATLLATQSGKQVELMLKSGQSIGGKVIFVGDTVVHLAALTGKEMYEATVSISDISAVVVRTAK
jgi:hypothetical protein